MLAKMVTILMSNTMAGAAVKSYLETANKPAPHIILVTKVTIKA